MQRDQGKAIPLHRLQTGTSNSTLAQPPLVGRGAEMDQMATRLSYAARRQGGVLFLVGEAGIGKTRLAHEALVLAREQGFLVLDGCAYALEGRLAYASILAAFGPFLRRLDSARQSRLVSGLPDLGRLFADLRLPAPAPLGDSALEKTRLFEAVARLLERLTQEAPVLLCLDDLHWADPASIELLHYLARGIADQPVLVLGTYRAEEINIARGLRSLITSLRRAGLAEEMVIARLGLEAVVELAAGTLGSEAPGELLTLLNARAGGTPLFVEALIRTLIDAGQLRKLGESWTLGTDLVPVLPPNIRDLILERLQHLDATERRVLDLIAVSGGAVPHEVLHEALGWEDEVLLKAVRRLHMTGLVVEDLNGAEVAYTLTHPLIQEVVYAELPEMTRRHAHAAFAVALERVRPDDLDRLAHHYRAAGSQIDPNRAFEVLLAAGERAYGLYANDQAARHFGAALGFIREGRRSELLPSVLERLGEAWERVGETAAAIAVWSEARTLHAQARNVSLLVRLHRRLALAEWDRGHFDIAQAHLAAGLQALAASEPSAELAELLHVQVILHRRRGDFNGMSAAAQNLAALAERLGSRRVLAEAYLACGDNDLDIVAAREVAQRGLTEAELADEPLLVQRAHDILALFAYGLGEHPVARHHAMLSLALARQLGAPTLELYPCNRLVSVDLMAGKWDEALRESAEVVAVARRLGFARGIAGTLSWRALVHVYRGDLDEAAACLAEAHEVFGGGIILDRNIFSQVAIDEMMLALEQGDSAGTLDAAKRLDQMIVSGGGSLLAQALLAEAWVMADEPERALTLAQDFMAHAPPDNVFATALGSRVKGLAQQALGRPTEALVCLDQASRAFTAVEMPFDAARASLEWATLAAAGDGALAVQALQESLAVFERLGARRYARRTRRLLYKLGIRPRNTLRARSSTTPLSRRELEIVQLVVEDLTNAEIAERLIISPRTVTTHLDRIYTRLGINSRTALVRYAIEAGLLPPTDRTT